VLQGCASPYQAPTPGATAKMRFVSNTQGANTFVHSYAAEDCSGESRIAALSGIAIVHGRQHLSFPLSAGLDEKTYTEATIPADKPFTFDMGFSIGSAYTGWKSCHVTSGFMPDADGLYEATFDLESGKCVVRVRSIVPSGTGYQRQFEPTAHKSAQQCRPFGNHSGP
jgi:hypothetical protein